jgi:hypothetical protein
VLNKAKDSDGTSIMKLAVVHALDENYDAGNLPIMKLSVHTPLILNNNC